MPILATVGSGSQRKWRRGVNGFMVNVLEEWLERAAFEVTESIRAEGKRNDKICDPSGGSGRRLDGHPGTQAPESRRVSSASSLRPMRTRMYRDPPTTTATIPRETASSLHVVPKTVRRSK